MSTASLLRHLDKPYCPCGSCIRAANPPMRRRLPCRCCRGGAVQSWTEWEPPGQGQADRLSTAGLFLAAGVWRRAGRDRPPAARRISRCRPGRRCRAKSREPGPDRRAGLSRRLPRRTDRRRPARQPGNSPACIPSPNAPPARACPPTPTSRCAARWSPRPRRASADQPAGRARPAQQLVAGGVLKEVTRRDRRSVCSSEKRDTGIGT